MSTYTVAVVVPFKISVLDDAIAVELEEHFQQTDENLPSHKGWQTQPKVLKFPKGDEDPLYVQAIVKLSASSIKKGKLNPTVYLENEHEYESVGERDYCVFSGSKADLEQFCKDMGIKGKIKVSAVVKHIY